MDFETLGFVVSFLFALAILLWFVIGSKGKWIIKVACIFSLLFLTFLNWHSINGMLGWSTPTALPEKFEVLWIVVKEPGAKVDGGIFILIRNINSKEERESSLFKKKDLQEPRLHRTDYTPEKHAQAQGIIGMLKKGKRVFGTSKKKGEGKGNGKKGEGKDGKGAGNPWGTEHDIKDMFYILPPMVPPQK